MKFNYDSIKENIRIYNEVKEKIPMISQYEKGEVNFNSMRSIGLSNFADFYNFSKDKNLICAISFKELKQTLIESDDSKRFKTYFKNRTQSQFNKLLTEDIEVYDRLLNGRWVTKPSYYGNRSRYGRRSNERATSLEKSIIPIINYIISNDIETSDNAKHGDCFKSFNLQDRYQNTLSWFKEVKLDIDSIPMREIEITTNLLKSLVNFIEDSNIDFRKLNCDFVNDTISQKVRNLMSIPTGTKIKSLVDLNNGVKSLLTKDKFYEVELSTISYGFSKVLLIDDTGLRSYYPYSNFEDVSIQRELLLNQLGIM
jgi:hypothetical protein